METGENMYKKKKISKPNVFEVWNGLAEKEKIYLYDPVARKAVLAWGRIEPEKLAEKPPFCFYTRRFSERVRPGEIWQEFLTEEIYFKYFIVTEEQASWLYYSQQEPEWREVPYPALRPAYRINQENYSHWEALFAAIQTNIASGRVSKVVGAREVEILCREQLNAAVVLSGLTANNPDSYIFAYQKAGKTFLGATPELLVKKQQQKILSYALAGTLAKTGQEEEAQSLLRDGKNNYEHQIVVEEIRRKMQTITPQVKVGSTEILELKNLYHLKTEIVAEDSSLSLDKWAELLHPTPAMGGKPQDLALQIIDQFEGYDRGLYAAPIGYTDAQGEGLFVVGIRSALMVGNKLYAYAGCGIVEQSDCLAEYEEINNKLRTILEALGEPENE